MVATQRPNRDALSRAVDIYRDAMRPFILRSLRRLPGGNVEDKIKRSLPDRQAENLTAALAAGSDLESALDVNYFPNLISNRYNWRDAFSAAFQGDKTIQNELWLITEARNQVSHPGTQDFEEEYTRTHLYHIADVLGKINAPQLKTEVENIRDQLSQRQATAQENTAPQLTVAGIATTSEQPNQPQTRGNTDLKPWREVIRPNQDIAQGSYQQAEFMAELQQVHDGRADNTQYGNPVSFFEHTYITPGIRALLVNSLKRLNGFGGDPVIQTKTGFGGGKTHSLIALYHLVRNTDALLNPQPGTSSATAEQIRSIMQEAGYQQTPDGLGEIAVLDGTYLSPTDSRTTTAGEPLNTLWGVMAYELADQAGYDIISDAARQGTAPGGAQLDELLDQVGPCAILMDELVNYIRNAGPFKDNIYTFIQNLTQSVRRSNQAILVITLPQSRAEAGGDAGAEAMDRLESILGRIEAVWEPLAINETFEVIKRRLFGPIVDEAAMIQTCQAFSRMYSNTRREYPQGTAEQNYLDRMKSCYPIHPEIFDRLYSDWSSIQEFQRTRGVLRMLSACISRLYLSNHPNYMIMPADLPLSDEALANEFIKLLSGNWRPVVSEADSDNSRTDNIDKESQRYAEVGGAARRVARTIFLGSASSGATRGLDQRQIHLGAVQPGQGVSLYNEALHRMAGDLYYLYSDDQRYFFHAEENLNKVANDRAEALTERAVEDYINRQMAEIKNRRPDVIIFNGDSAEVEDTDSVRLVVLPPTLSLPTRSQENDTAGPEALKILQWKGDVPRIRRNTVLFLTAKRDEIRSLTNEVRKYLAWDSLINGPTKIQTLSGDRLSQATANVRSSETSVRTAMVRAFRWALAPVQPDPQKAEYELNQQQIDATDSGEIIRRTFGKLQDEEVLSNTITPGALSSLLQQYIWNQDGGRDHIGINALWDMLTSNVYLYRLREKSVLMDGIELGVHEGTLAYATNWDGQSYNGLLYADATVGQGPLVAERDVGYLVRPEVAEKQKSANAPPGEPEGPTTNGKRNGNGEPSGPGHPDHEDEPGNPPDYQGPRIITTRKLLGADISLDDINNLREEIIRNLAHDGGMVTVEITISAQKGDGFSQDITRSIRENSAQLGLEFTTDDDL